MIFILKKVRQCLSYLTNWWKVQWNLCLNLWGQEQVWWLYLSSVISKLLQSFSHGSRSRKETVSTWLVVVKTKLKRGLHLWKERRYWGPKFWVNNLVNLQGCIFLIRINRWIVQLFLPMSISLKIMYSQNDELNVLEVPESKIVVQQ